MVARTEFTEAVVGRAAPTAAPPETAVIRLVGALPAGWDCSWRLQEERILLRVQPVGGAGPDAVEAWLAGVLAAGGLRGWQAVR
ncbi:hypothetical protein [Streptomyces hiroshimensis]|uniref:Uncharacterized protein n=1 Tax=Streptomyces hiroshimensis TaxID=66424 RepID=A0ABQ2Z5K2_9ACTN|nr:hypothetical protein [Streptomyces hiroshimensis]GGY05154.1 hypothetical protein GCM10010324_59890 [Streptomyces hiroshimensis]